MKVIMPEHTPAPTPHRAVYGFAIYMLFFTLFIMYVLWAILPPTGKLSYLPDRYFAINLPMVVLVGLTLFIFFIYPAINLSMTPDVDELSSVVDPALFLRRDASPEQPLTSWAQLVSAPTSSSATEARFVAHCDICQTPHRPTTAKPIATLRFMDLAEVNKDIFA